MTEDARKNYGGLYEVLGQFALSDIGEVLALRAQMEQQQQKMRWKQELAEVERRIAELRTRRRELTALEGGESGA